MSAISPGNSGSRPAPWSVALAFAILYLSWGTTYLAIKEGVKTLPPALFGGTRIVLAALILLTYLALRGESIRIWGRELLWTALGGLILFMGGNGLLSVASGVLPLQIYGSDRYAVRQAMVLTPARYLQALAPATFALALDTSVALALVLSSVVCLAMLPLTLGLMSKT